MTHKILKSAIDGIPDFAVRAAAHAHELRNWRAHQARVEADAKNPDLPAIERHIGHPPPSEHPVVMSAVNEADEVDFEIVDDGPTPAQRLAAKKVDLLREVALREQNAIAAIVPAGKRRLFNLRENDIRAADTARAMALTADQGVLKSAAAAVGIGRKVDIAAEVEKGRPAADTQFLAEQADRRRKMEAIERAAAQAHHDVEDLTIETIDAWQVPDFSK